MNRTILRQTETYLLPRVSDNKIFCLISSLFPLIFISNHWPWRLGESKGGPYSFVLHKTYFFGWGESLDYAAAGPGPHFSFL